MAVENTAKGVEKVMAVEKINAHYINTQKKTWKKTKNVMPVESLYFREGSLISAEAPRMAEISSFIDCETSKRM